MSALIILLSLFSASCAANALFLWLGTKWVKAPNATLVRAFGAAIVLGLISIVAYFASQWMRSEMVIDPLLAMGIQVGVGLAISWLALMILFRTSLWRAVGSWLPTLIPNSAMFALIYLVLWPHVLAAYITSSHAMAPTLLGLHQRGLCPNCGQPATVQFHEGFDAVEDTDRLGMCSSCMQAGKVAKLDSAVEPPDRFIVSKLITPRRWDLVIFRSPHDPSVRYVKRLIGLPGERLVIKDGAIWINGVKQLPPPEIAALTFSAGLGWDEKGWGSPEKPMLLAEGEYFVIGDFSLHSMDSRAWGVLPGENIEGVVSIIYWPLSRWRLFR